MDRDAFSRRLAIWAAYLVVMLMLIGARLMPLGTEPGGWPGPDLLSALTFAWVLRRPEAIPVTLIAAVMLVGDLMLQRPPGLWAALVLGGSEVLRARARTTRPLYFSMEWGLVTLLLAGMILLNWLALTLTLAPKPELVQALWAGAITVAAYPLPVLALRLAGVRRHEYPQGVIRGARG